MKQAPKASLSVPVLCLVVLVATFVFRPLPCSAAVAVNGSIKTAGAHTVLNLWGTGYEMGFAHGYLLADKIRNVVDTFMVGTMAGGDVARYNNFIELEELYVTYEPQYLEELDGIAAGIAASGKNLYVPRLGRNIDVRDIKVLNLAPELSFFCTDFGVWKEASVNGETILARNLDFLYDPQGNFVNNQLLITYEPVNGTKFVSVSWPGFVGIVSGLNEHGVSVMVNMGNGEVSTTDGPFHSSLEVFRRILETSTADNYLTQPLSIVNSMDEYSTFIIQIGAPSNGSATDPVYYIEDSTGENVIRYAADTNPGYNHIIASNHFIKVIPPPTSGDSLDRYRHTESALLSLYRSGDGKVDATEAWTILDSVADLPASSATLASIIVKPGSREFALSFARLINGSLTVATQTTPQIYTWPSLFPNHSANQLPDLSVQSIVANSAAPAAGAPVNVTVTVLNQGLAAADAFSLDFYKNLASMPATNQAGDARCVINGLAAGSTSSCTFSVTYVAAGSYRMWAQADTRLQVEEIDESNNVMGPRTITVTGGADLAVSSLTAPLTARANQVITVRDTTRNNGPAAAGPSITRFYGSTSSTYNSSATYLGARAVGNLAAGASSSASTYLRVPAGTPPGRYYIIARADADNAVMETNEGNNNRSQVIYVVR